jgi:hypothetical protein
MKEAALVLCIVTAVVTMFFGVAIGGKIQSDNVIAQCRTEMLQANRSTDDIVKVCLNK